MTEAKGVAAPDTSIISNRVLLALVGLMTTIATITGAYGAAAGGIDEDAIIKKAVDQMEIRRDADKQWLGVEFTHLKEQNARVEKQLDALRDDIKRMNRRAPP